MPLVHPVELHNIIQLMTFAVLCFRELSFNFIISKFMVIDSHFNGLLSWVLLT